MESTFYIRAATQDDLDDIVRINTEAFGQIEEANLVRELLQDDTAKPTLSLLAFDDGAPVGHILFTRVTLEETDAAAVILAPMAVLPAAQGKRVGGRLIRVGLELLGEDGVELVFVLGHPGYYPRYGFRPAGALGYAAPYPIPLEHAGAWMVQELIPGVINRTAGKVRCAAALDHPELWSE
jgi:predicted N-acetyltransferase YhbS